MPTKSCLTCGYRTLNPQQCPLIGYQYTEDRNVSCPYWVAELVTCAICGNIIPKKNYCLTHFKDGSWQPTCDNCLKLSGTCGGCSKSSTCDFETNPSPLPKAVQKQIRQGNQILVTTVKNPSRIEATCKKNCDCWDEENQQCSKEYGCCSKYTDNLSGQNN